MNNPYQAGETKPQPKPASKGGKFWSWMLLIAIVYTLVGLGFVLWCYLNMDSLLNSENDASSLSVLNHINLLTIIIWGGITFTVSGITSVVICLIMKSKVSGSFDA